MATESSLGAENRDPKLTQEEARAVLGQKAAAANRDLVASPFQAINLDTIPSFTKPLPASKTKEFPSAASSHQLAAASPTDGPRVASPAQANGRTHQVWPASPAAREGSAAKPEDSERATAPPAAVDTSGSHSPSGEGTAVLSAAADALTKPSGRNKQGQVHWDKAHAPVSPNTPLALPDSSELSFRQSEPLQSSSCNDSGFSLLWDDDPFWQVSPEPLLNACCQQMLGVVLCRSAQSQHINS